ncbi:MAG: ABC transporter permease [Tissierellaceae bacterium]|nr:ABC transporter permease [Tissierellaceae bacterium]
MKLLAYIKLSIKSIIREFPSFVLSYGVYPLVIALVMGYVQKDMFTPSISEPIFSVIIRDEDDSEQSRNLVAFLNSDEISQVMTVKNSEEGKFDYTLRIPEGYENSLLGNGSSTVKVEAEEKSSTSLGNILVSIVDRYNQEASQGLTIQRNIEKLPVSSGEKEKILSDINHILINANGSNSIKANLHTVKKSLDSYEYYSVTFLSFVFFIFLIAVISSDALEKEIGLYHRIMSTPMTRLEYFHYGFVSNYLTMIIANTIYVLVYRITGLSFGGSWALLAIIVSIQSLMITVIGTLISAVFKKKYGLILVQILLMTQMVIGGIIGPAHKFTSNAVLQGLSKLKPDILISNTYKNYMLVGSLSSISNYLLVMIGISLVLYMLNVLVVQMKWGVSK